MFATLQRLISIFALMAACGASAPAAQQRTSTSLPANGPLQVAGSVRIAPGVHVRAPREIAPGGPRAVIWARGVRNAVIDLSGVTLSSDALAGAPDRLSGVALHLDGCENVTVRGGLLRGFKSGVVVQGGSGIRIEGLRCEQMFRQRLASTAIAPEPSDRLARTENDLGQWLAQYGAAIALSGCEGAVVTGCRVRQAQNGLLLERCQSALVYDNDFSFLSGWGIALHRSNDNRLVRNRCDECVRGYSHGAYADGQGSAGILLVERCSDNWIVENRARGCGDGLSLFAGRDLVEGLAAARGELAPGGCDRNLIYRNDLSGALESGIEISFSRENRVIENVADDCLGYGFQGAYCERTLLVENSFCSAAGSGLAIEHGQECWIARNVLERCGAGLELYWDDDPQYVAGAFGRARDTASRDHWIWSNAFADNAADLRIRATSGLRLAQNVFQPREAELVASALTLAPGESADVQPRDLLRGVGGFLPSGSIVDSSVRTPPEYPPEEFVELERVASLDLPGKPSAARAQGLKFERSSIVIGEWGPWDFESGEPKPTLRPVGGVFAGCRWNVGWISWKDGADPRAIQPQGWVEAVRERAVERAEVEAIGDPWCGREEVRAAVGETHFGLHATTRLTLPAGRYLLRVTSDDGVRVRVGPRRAIENWTWHSQHVDEALLELEAGEHEFSVDYFQVDGGAALSLDLIAR